MVVPVAEVDVGEDITGEEMTSDVSAEAAKARVVLVAPGGGAGEDCEHAGSTGADAGGGAFTVCEGR